MKSFFLKTIIISLLALISIQAQYINNGFSISAGTNYTTSAKLYLNPNSTDLLLRNQYSLIEGIISYSLDIRYRLSQELIIGIGSEYLAAKGAVKNISVSAPGGTQLVEVNDGFRMIPIEITAYYLMPFSSEKFKFYMYGGAGYYFGNHIREIGDAEFENLNFSTTPGLHVGFGTDYMILENLSVRGEMKFREPEFDLTTKYSNSEINLPNQTIKVLTDKFDSKVNIDGITFSLSMAFHF